MSTYEQFIAVKNLGSAVGNTDPSVLIAGKDNSGNRVPFKFDADGKLLTAGAGGGGDATAANQATEISRLESIITGLGTLLTQTDGLEGLLTTIAGKDFATQLTLAAVLAKLSADPATQTTLAAVLAKLSADPATQTTLAAVLTAVQAATPAGENVIGKTAGYGFDVVVAPGVTNGAYSAGDIMGGLLTFTVARANDEAVLINEIQIAFKSAVTPSLLLVLLEADPTSTTKTDNSAYSLAVADVFKVRAALPVNTLGGYLTDHGTPNTIRLPNLNLAMKPVSGGKDIYMLMIDLTGVTLTSTSDVQVRVCGFGA